MPAPSSEAIQQALSHLQSGAPLQQKNFFNLLWGYAHHPDPDHFLLQTNASNEKLAETLIVFRRSLHRAAAGGDLEGVIGQAFSHYVVNTDGQIPQSEEDDPFDVFEAAARYAKALNVGLRRQEDGTSLLHLDGKDVPGPQWGITPGWSAAWSFRKAGPVINRLRYGRDDFIPSFAFGFDENANGHSLHNALTLADFSHLAYFGPDFVEKQLQQWGYLSFQWVENLDSDTQAFVTGRDDYLIVCFRGTSSGKDALVDTRFRKMDAFGGKGRVHRGFEGALSSVWDQARAAVDALGPKKRLFLAGHSLGAALAQLAAHRYALKGYPVDSVYVYGSPRVGNPEFRDAYNKLLEEKTFLHINNSDIVAQIPPRILGFRHLGGSPRLFDQEHAITLKPVSRSIFGEEEEKDFEELDEESQEAILRQMEEVQKSMEASASFMNAPPDLMETANSRGLFTVRAVDDHSMNEYLFKFGRALLDGERERLGG